ncbi:outer membrane beta-barrel protein [Alphaproteobacteria bacterium]|nr:outer membrane beta-barrel protein [Alphaproteobacteria bacterium]
MTLKKMITYASFGILVCAPIEGFASNIIAQDIKESHESSNARTPADLSPQPVQWGSFLLYPSLNLQGEYQSNIFYQNTGEKTDFIWTTRPAIDIEKSIRDHKFSLKTDIVDRRYLGNSDESTQDYNIEFKSNVVVTSSLKIPTQISFSDKALSRSAPGSIRFTTNPVYSKNFNARSGLSYRFNRVNLSLIGNYDRLTYEDSTSKLNGRQVVFSNKDRSIHGATLLAAYDIMGNQAEGAEYTLFAGLSYQREKFDDFVAAGVNTAPLRSNHQKRVLVGIKTTHKNLLIGEIGGGYYHYDYDSTLAAPIENFDIYADLKYLITPKLTLSAMAERSINQDNDFSRGFEQTDYALGAEYEFLHNFYGTLQGTYSFDEFIGSNREDDTHGISAGIRYLHSPKFESRVRALYETQNSTQIGGGYDQNIFTYSLVGRL